MSDEKTMKDTFIENIAKLATPEGVQQYLLGTKKNGSPRAVYDVVRDYTKPKKKKKHNKKSQAVGDSTYAFYLNTKKKKKKKHKKDDKHWHI